jgi:putative ATP-binding cassette transporter
VKANLWKLKSRGNTVVVITHDDRYFEFGDRVIKLDYGKVVPLSQPTVPASYFAT